MKQTVALTGATGFLGSHLIDDLLAQGHNVRALTRRKQDSRDGVEWIKGDLSDPAALMALTKKADLIIHAAGLTKANSRTEFFQINRDCTERMLKCARDNGAKRFLLIKNARENHCFPRSRTPKNVIIIKKQN